MIVKVCGLKDVSNIFEVANVGIEMIGLNFYHPSPRYVDTILSDLPDNIMKAGVFVNETLDNIIQKKDTYQLDYIQLHGDETPAFALSSSKILPVIKVFRINEVFDPDILNEFEFCDYYLFDTHATTYGGSGKKFKWDQLHDYNIKVPFLLSGGIGPDDLQDIISFRHDFFKGIDINSCFEVSPGIKDVSMIQNFIHSLQNQII